ncbi:deoxyribose-phosphate aldolase [Candidatus Gottesmanbacteria bacterium]|nr:deoxyribose-phosphate aldolase [Candidatus Gottesmanbacteria bacterium]
MLLSSIAPHLDLANHHADATAADIKRLCADVVKYSFNAGFVNPCYIALAKEELKGKAKVGTALSFPLGQDTLEMKVFAAREAIRLGADELDVGANNGLLLFDETAYLEEMKAIVSALRQIQQKTIIKFILETGYLHESNIRAGAKAILASGADFVKICSGMGPRGASLDDVRLVKEAIGTAPINIKVAGSIDTLEEARAFLSAGAQRIGTSKAVEIMEQVWYTTPI